MFNANNDSGMQEDQAQYKDLVATRLYCHTCRASMPVRERLLLILPDGYLYEYWCTACGDVLGDKKVSLKSQDKRLF